MSPRKIRRSPRSVAAPVVPVVDSAFLADLAADDATPPATALAATSGLVATFDVTPVAPAAAPTVATMRRRSPTVAAFLAGDLTPSAPADTSIGATLRACGIDPALVTVPGTPGIVNVTPASHYHDSAALDVDALDTVSAPATRNAATLRYALSLVNAACALLDANPTHLLTNACNAPFRTPGDVHAIATAARILYFRAMIVHPRCPANFAGNRVSPLDVVASLARAAARLSGDDLPSVGNGAACRASVPVLRASIATRVANLDS